MQRKQMVSSVDTGVVAVRAFHSALGNIDHLFEYRINETHVVRARAGPLQCRTSDIAVNYN